MNGRARLVGAAILLAATAPAPAASADGSLTGRATVIDGNTLRIGRSEITLHGLRAPRPGRVCTPFRGGPPIPCGDMATAALEALVPARAITCTPKGTRGGTLRAVCRADAREINRAMVEDGWARAVPGEGMAYGAAEKRAVRRRAGLWRHLLVSQ